MGWWLLAAHQAFHVHVGVAIKDDPKLYPFVIQIIMKIESDIWFPYSTVSMIQDQFPLFRLLPSQNPIRRFKPGSQRNHSDLTIDFMEVTCPFASLVQCRYQVGFYDI
ncbi:hypothetical protein L6452_07225 [Arctium lappa]|uniref:Uncharacterized protein n=1 Tax=Arctium lappa TaxID=4217 RepID=A0ACB9EKT2_ARCLA|nr:hypothetical protein L6452_07225 [Arctium lappa]